MAQQPNYTPEQVQQALENGMISEQDAEYLNKALEDTMPWGGIAGGIGGAVAGAAMGAGGSKMAADAIGDWGAKAAAKDGASATAGANRKGVSDWMNSPVPTGNIPFTEKALPETTKGQLALGGAGALGLGAGGAYAGDTLLPNEGMGVEGAGAMDPSGAQMDQDMALRMLVDPSTPPEVKKKILEALQSNPEYQESQMDGEEEGGMDALAGAGLGALGGAALGAAGGQFGAKALGGMTPAAGDAAGTMMGGLKNSVQGLGASGSAPAFASMPNGLNMGGAVGGGVGGLAGGGIGALMASGDPTKKYQDPLGG